MIISKNNNPERDLYYLGAKAIEILNSYQNKEFDYYDLFIDLNKTMKITINLYSLVLDWLFIIGVISKCENGFIKKCF